MPDDPTLPFAVGGVVLSVFGWLLNREVRRNDSYGDRIAELEHTIPNCVQKTDLDRTESRIIAAIGETKASINSAHDRIDRLRDRQ